MKLFFYIFAFIICFTSHSQQVNGIVVDNAQIGIPGIRIKNLANDKQTFTDPDGKFSIQAIKGEKLLIYAYSYDSVIYQVKDDKEIKVLLKSSVLELAEANVNRKRLAGFDVGFLPAVRGVQIFTGTNTIIELAALNGAKSTGNAREIFAKVPGLNIWESDGSGIQIGIGGRGLSPNRTANFNTRQNGYDISADALGYPESYYIPPYEALKSIEIIRGSASLQFGTQFGGLLNFVIKEAPSNTALEFTSRNTIGSFGYLGTFNRVTGTANRIAYQVYHQYKEGSAYRENSNFHQNQFFGQFGYFLNEKTQVRLEYTHMDYLAKQAGGLSDLQFTENDQQSFRERNWFRVNWNMLALHYDWQISQKSTFNLRTFGMLSERQTLGFLGKITQADPGGNREMIAGDFKNAGVEARFLKRYNAADNFKGAFLVGARYYRGYTTSDQGTASDGDQADFQYQNPDDLENSSFEFPSENAAFFAENILFIGKRWSVNSGLRLEYIASSSSGFYKQYLVHPVNNDTLNIFTRRDSNSVIRKVPLLGFGTSYRLKNTGSIYTNFTQNYRAINFTDIRVNNPNIVVDSMIRDEYGYTAELGFRGLLKDYWIYDVAGFYIFYGDKIGLAPKPGTIIKERTNIGNAQNLGIELFTEFDFFKAFIDSSKQTLSLFANLSYINANYIDSREANYVGKKVEYVSNYILRGGIKYKIGGLSLQFMASYNSEQFSDASNSVEPSGDAVIGLIPSYFVMDFSARYVFKRYWQIETGVNNLRDEKYFTRRATGYPGPGILPSDGRSIYLTLQFKFALKRGKI